MARLTVHNLPDDVHRALRLQAARHGRSTEAEVGDILAAAVRPAARVRLGDALAAISRAAGVTDDDVTALEHARISNRAELSEAAGLQVIDPWD